VAWCGGVVSVECCDFFRRIVDILYILPSVSFHSITFPLNQVLEALLEHSAVQYFLYHVFFFAVDEFGRGRQRRMSADDWVRRCWGQFDDVEHWVKELHRQG
jgi:hypothetical protein